VKKPVAEPYHTNPSLQAGGYVAILSFAGLQAHSFFVFCLEDAGLKAELKKVSSLTPP
jgi:hypothetical protein